MLLCVEEKPYGLLEQFELVLGAPMLNFKLQRYSRLPNATLSAPTLSIGALNYT